eukprot:gene28076-33902_t
MWGTLPIFIGHCLMATFYGDQEIANRRPFCSWEDSDSDITFYLNGAPLIAYFGISCILVLHALYVCVSTSLKVAAVDRKPFMKIWRAYSMLFLFLFVQLAIYPVTLFLLFTYHGFVMVDTYVESFQDWVRCVFAEYSPSTLDTYLQTCGMHPAERPSVLVVTIPYLVVNLVGGLLLICITMNKEVRQFYAKAFDSFLQTVGLTKLLGGFVPEEGKKMWKKILAPKATSYFSTTSASSYSEDSQASGSETRKKGASRCWDSVLGGGNAAKVDEKAVKGWGGKILELSLTLKYKGKYAASNTKVVPVMPSPSSHGEITIVGGEVIVEEGGEAEDSGLNLFQAQQGDEGTDRLFTGKEKERGEMLTSRQDSNSQHEEV